MATLPAGRNSPYNARSTPMGAVMATLRVGPSRLPGFAARLATWPGLVRTSRAVRAVAAIGFVVFCLVLAGTVALILELRQREVRDARRGLSNINAVVTEATSRALQSVDLVLTAVADDLKAGGVATVAGFRRLGDDQAVYDMLRTRVAALPQLNGISLVAPDGKVVVYSRAFPTPAIDLADREHFRALLRPGVAEPFLSEPVQNRGTGEWTVYLARRITNGTGELVGIAYAAIELGYFLDLYGSLEVRPDSSVALWRFDGTLLARRPDIGNVGQRFATPAFDRVNAASPPLVYETGSAIDGEARIVARRVITGFPLAIVTTLSMPGVLAEWRRQAAVLAGFGALLAGAATALSVALIRQFAAFEQVARATRDSASAIKGLQDVEAQLRQSQKLEIMGQMTSGVAHDFNNLLTIVLGNLERLGRRLPADPPELGRALAAAQSGAERAAGLTQRLLAFSRRQPLEPSLLDVNDLVGGMTDILRQTLGFTRTLELELAPGLPPVFADASGLESALLNLVVNARDAMPKGGTVTVRTEERASGTGGQTGHVALSVDDSGTGMSPEVARRALEPFFTTKEAGVGTGLGLAQVYGFVRQTGGELLLDSREGVGTRVSMVLPYRRHPAKGVGGTGPVTAGASGART